MLVGLASSKRQGRHRSRLRSTVAPFERVRKTFRFVRATCSDAKTIGRKQNEIFRRCGRVFRSCLEAPPFSPISGGQ